MLLPLIFMYILPEQCEPLFLRKRVLELQNAIRKALKLIRGNTTAQQLRRSALYNHNVLGPVFKEGVAFSFNPHINRRVSAPNCPVKGEALTAPLNVSMT